MRWVGLLFMVVLSVSLVAAGVITRLHPRGVAPEKARDRADLRSRHGSEVGAVSGLVKWAC